MTGGTHFVWGTQSSIQESTITAGDLRSRYDALEMYTIYMNMLPVMIYNTSQYHALSLRSVSEINKNAETSVSRLEKLLSLGADNDIL